MKKLKQQQTQSKGLIQDGLVFKKIKKGLMFSMCCLAVSYSSYAAVENNEVIKMSINKVVKKKNLAQTLTVSGAVQDATQFLPGVNVMVKGTSKGTVTDFDGNFTLDDVNGSDVLVFSFMGYVTQEIPVNGQGLFNIILVEDEQSLEEVIIVGYTSKKKGDITGAISTIGTEVLEQAGSKDLDKSLAGKVSGLIVSDRGGAPGSNATTLLIRGKSTLNNNEPLILIDNVPAASFSHLAPSDIASLSVLKDGAAAIYGARAANGVILVTTKRGRLGKPKINLSTQFSWSTFSATPNLMTSTQYAIYENEIAARKGQDLPYSQSDINNYESGNDPINYPSTDWADLTFADTAPESRTTLSVSGGGEDVSYFVSGDYLSQEGMYKSGDLSFEQYQIRSNLDIKLHKKLKLGVDLSGRFGENNAPGVDDAYIYKHIYTNEPTQVGIYPNGLTGWGGENGANPYIMSSSETGFVQRYDNDLRGKFSLDWNLESLTEGLRLTGFAGVRKMSNDEKSWYTPWTVYSYQEGGDPEYVAQQGFSQRGNTRILRESFYKYDELMLNATLYYNHTFDDAHSFNTFVGIEQTTSNQRNFYAERRGFPSDDHPELFAGSDDGQQSFGSSQEWGRLNYFGSVSYNYKQRYYVDLTIRYDGSSNFGDGNQFGTFPGAAVSWSIGNEEFMESVTWIDELKLRASWALMGNDRIPSFQFLTRYDYGGIVNTPQPNFYVFGSPGVSYNGYNPDNVANPNITWEKADMSNIGINFYTFKSRLSVDANYFYQKRKDILITRNASIPEAVGITLPQENLGQVNSWGWEFDLSWNDQIGDITYNLGANFTNAQNKVVYMDEAENVPEWRKQEGHSIDSYIVYPTDGIFNDQAEVDATLVKKDGTVAGEPIYLDTDGNGKIDANDRIRTYSSNVPQIQYGVYGGIGYKNFNFNFLFQGQAKAKVLVFFDQAGAKPDYIFNERWTPENSNSDYPRAFAQGDQYSGNQSGDEENLEVADVYLMDAAFVRLKELELAYSLSKDEIGIGDLRMFVRGYNLFTFGSEVYKRGLDPEADGYSNFRNSTYPSLTSFSVGLNLSF
ncbi:TonB-dependent receptor [Formosa sp. PL04]|uniref:SusC/RagA family TonB-linked outer membrane protein n=1 Tax=Formosa sp. PL04 TaxID=3081755 RepID=UPI002980E098|nr:TonB-dependent receptor [Formosa sp. PL04]MDW5288050.1 TonB-dependent receptor [Formosa sp. PL04]